MTTKHQDERETEALLAEIRSLEPPVGIDPPWEQMARDIRVACDAVDARRARGIAARVRAFLHPRHIVMGAVAAVAAVAVFVLIRGAAPEQTGAPAPLATAVRADAGAAIPPTADTAAGEPVLLRTAALDELDDDELDALDEALRDPGAFVEDDDTTISEPPVLAPEVLAEAEMPDEDEVLGGHAEHYEALLDDLSDTDMDNLDALLARHQPG